MPTSSAPDFSQPPPRKRRTFWPKPITELIEQGDLLGLMEALATQHPFMTQADKAAAATSCIETKARLNPSDLVDDGFVCIIELALTLFVRVQLHIADTLESADLAGGSRGLPRDLAEQGWLDRAERLAKFISEIATARTRVRHLNRLEDEHDKRRDAMSIERAEPENGREETLRRKPASDNGRTHVESRVIRSIA